MGNQVGEEEEVELPNFPDPMYHVIDDVDSGDSDDAQSVGSDSECSEEFVDSDAYVSDDELFKNNVDCDVEWGTSQLQQGEDEGCSTGVVTRSKKNVSVEKEKMKTPTFPVFNRKVDLVDPHFEVTMTFPDHNEFKAAVRAHSIKWGRDVKFIMNQPEKVQAKCMHTSCNWQIYAAQIKGEPTMQVRTYCPEHKCPRLQKISHANAKWVASKYYDRLCLDPQWNVDVMGVILKNEVKLCFTRHQLYRAKKKAASMGGGNYSEQYALLWNYAEEIKIANPETTVMIKCKLVGEQLMFKRMYICWGPLKKGLLENCIKILSLDGCHLKSICGGILLTVVGMDANNDPYPVAYAIMEKEKKKSWAWFLKLLKKDLKIENPYSWTIMSDKQKGLIDAVDEVLGGCEHRFCVMHLYQNFKLQHKGLALKYLLWKAARNTRVVDFERTIKELKDRDAKAFEWLAKRPPAHWSKSHFSTFSKSDMLLNNLSECFNSMVLKARKLPMESTPTKGSKRKDSPCGTGLSSLAKSEGVKTPTAKKYKSQCLTNREQEVKTTTSSRSTRSSVGKSPEVKITTPSRSTRSSKGKSIVVPQPKARKKLPVTRKPAELSTQASTNIVAEKDKGKKFITPEGMSNVKFSTSKGRSSNLMTATPTPKQGQGEHLGSYWVSITKN